MIDKRLLEKWNKQIDTKALVGEVKDIQENGGFEEVPCGTYEVEVNKMEFVATKSNNDPMLTIWFKVTEGDHKHSLIFYNQVLTRSIGIHNANEIMRAMDTGLTIEFNGDYADYADLIADVFEKVSKKVVFELDYGENNKGYKTYEITDVFDLD